ncbi:MAG: hypothetical protein GXY42_06135 [Desulfovibrionales bacterium]|nr:hypothetical protein [Desulfovibrionales bacterium]
MTPKPRLLLRILETIIHWVWSVLFFLTVLSLLFLANHYWDIILAMVQTVHSLVLKGAELLRAL